MSSEKCARCERVAEVWTRLEEVQRLSSVIDVMITQATEAGLDKGRVLGLLEAASALDRAGYPELGDAVRRVVDDDAMVWDKPAGEA
jgi:hypothetical protein